MWLSAQLVVDGANDVSKQQLGRLDRRTVFVPTQPVRVRLLGHGNRVLCHCHESQDSLS